MGDSDGRVTAGDGRERRDALAWAVEGVFETDEVPALAELVELPSASREAADVEVCFTALDRHAAALDLTTDRHPDPRGEFAAHRVYSTPAVARGDKTAALALVGHLDTVFPRALGFLGFRREGDVARGPGVLDMKSGLVSVLFALRALKAVDLRAFERLAVRFLVVSDEEVGSPSSKPLIDTLAGKSTAALVFEAGRAEDRIVTRRKGSGLWTLVAHGKAAHAGASHAAGVSAIHALSLAIPQVEALTDYDRGLTTSVGIVEGGTAKNTVPDRASAHIDARFVHASDIESFERALAAIARDPFTSAPPVWVPERLTAARLEVLGGVSRPPMEPGPGTDALRARYQAAALEAGLNVGEAPLQGGGSDANLFAAHSVPTIDGLGPFGQHFHEMREWCSLDSLRRRTTALAFFLSDTCARDEGPGA